MKQRVVITGMGMLCPLGTDGPTVFERLREGRADFTPSPWDDQIPVARIADFDLKAWTGRYKHARYLNRGAAFALAAALDAVAQAGLDEADLEGAGLFTGAGPNMDLGQEIPQIKDGEILDHGQALFLLKFLPNTAASAISARLGIHGENQVVGTACAAALQALGEAFRKIRDGYLDLALAGGGDSRINPGGSLAYSKAGALHRGSADSYAPFGKDRCGFVKGEGGAFFVLESLDHARKRKAPILGEVLGFGVTMDGHNMTAPRPDGKYAEAAVLSALGDAKLTPGDIHTISAHGTGTPLNDAMEAEMLTRVFGNGPRITAFKSWVGHLSAACGAVETALALICAAHGWLPGVKNLEIPCREDLDLLQTPAREAVGPILLENFGFGGQNAALVVHPWKP